MKATYLMRLGVTAVTLILLGTTASDAQAQYYYGYRYRNPYYGSPAYYQAYAWAHYPNPYRYWGYPPSYYDPYGGGYLRGGADVISAQARFLAAIQEANLLREQVLARRTENRRSAFDQYLYERERMPSFEQLRAEERARRLDWARNDPPVTEIYSGAALNELLADLQQVPLAGLKDVPVDAATVRRVNLTSVQNGANIGLVRSGGLPAWPEALAGLAYQAVRDRLNAMVQAEVERAKVGKKPDAATFRQMHEDLDTLDRKLRETVLELTASQFIDANRFLNQFADALKALEQPDAANYFNGRYEFQGKTVADLVKFMKDRGLWFAPAVAGDEPAYVTVHRALASYSLDAQTALLKTAAQRP